MVQEIRKLRLILALRQGSTVNNVGEKLVKKKVVMLEPNKIDTINNSGIHDTCRNFYVSEKERKGKLLQGIQSANGIKARVGAKKSRRYSNDSYNQRKCSQKTFGKRLETFLDFDFLKHTVYDYGLKDDLIVKLELNSSEKVILCSGDTAATCKILDILLQ